jgi:hypothetical protein
MNLTLLALTATAAGLPQGVSSIDIKSKIALIDVSDIRDREQEFDVELYLYTTWQDPNLADAGAKPGREIPMAEHWQPNLEFMQMRENKIESDNMLTVAPDGTAVNVQHVWATLSTPFDLRKFPFDRHVLPIAVESFSFDHHKLKFVSDAEGLTTNNLRVTDGWKVKEIRSRVDEHHYPEENTKYSRFIGEVVVHRDSGYYLWKIVLPLVLIIAMSWAVFWMDPEELEARMGLAVTSMLAVVAFNFAIADTLPKISYVTRMDVFIVLGYVFIFGAFIENLITHILNRKDRYDDAVKLDVHCQKVLPGAFAIVLAMFLGWP